MYTIDKNLTIENASIGFKNFSGKEGQFNPVGRRNFCVFFDEETANNLKNEGWNIRWLKPKSEEDDPVGYLQVAVSFDHIPPKIILVTKRGKTQLDEESIGILDNIDISSANLDIRPYDNEGTYGPFRSAYLQSMEVIQNIDRFSARYASEEYPEE